MYIVNKNITGLLNFKYYWIHWIGRNIFGLIHALIKKNIQDNIQLTNHYFHKSFKNASGAWLDKTEIQETRSLQIMGW